MLFALLLLVGAALASRLFPDLVPYLIVLLGLVLLNLLGTLDLLLGELLRLHWSWAQLALLGLLLWGLFKHFRGGLIFLAALLLLNVSGLGLQTQRLAWGLYGLERRPEGQRVFCPDRLEVGAKAYRITDRRTGHSILVRAGRSALTHGPALCAVTARYLPLPDRFDRWDDDRNDVRTYMSVSDYRAVVFYPSLQQPKFTFPISISGGVMRLRAGQHPQWGVKIDTVY